MKKNLFLLLFVACFADISFAQSSEIKSFDYVYSNYKEILKKNGEENRIHSDNLPICDSKEFLSLGNLLGDVPSLNKYEFINSFRMQNSKIAYYSVEPLKDFLTSKRINEISSSLIGHDINKSKTYVSFDNIFKDVPKKVRNEFYDNLTFVNGKFYSGYFRGLVAFWGKEKTEQIFKVFTQTSLDKGISKQSRLCAGDFCNYLGQSVSKDKYIGKLYYYHIGVYYYYTTINLFIGGEKQTEINSFADALSHYRSGAGGVVKAGPGLIREMKSHKTYTHILKKDLPNSIKKKLMELPIGEDKGVIYAEPGSDRGLECLTLGHYRFNINYQANWTASGFFMDNKDFAIVYRFIYTQNIPVQFDGEDLWDFEWNPKWDIWQNITTEYIPGAIAGSVGNPKVFSITYETEDVINSMTVKQEI